MCVAHNVLRYAADEQMAESSAAMRGNNDKIDVVVCGVANLSCWGTVNHASGISQVGSCYHGAHLFLRRIRRFTHELGLIERRILIAKRIGVRVNHMQQAQFRFEIASKSTCMSERDP